MNIKKLVSCAAIRVVSIENREMKLIHNPIVVTKIIIAMIINGKNNQFIVRDCPKQMNSMMNSIIPIVKSTIPSNTFENGMQMRGKYSLLMKF